MTDCIFCKIIKGEIPCAKVYENDKVFAFIDMAPVNKGHTLIVPKEHYENLMELPDDVAAEVAIVAKKISKAVKQAVGAEGINIVQNNGKAAGQAVFHFHLHVIPRFDNDGLKPWPHKKYEQGEEKEFGEKVKKAL